MLDEVEREGLAERKTQRDAANTAPQRKTRGDGSQYDTFPDARIVEVDSDKSFVNFSG